MKASALFSWGCLMGLIVFAGCRGPVSYEDPGSTQPLTTQFSLSDVNILAERMTESMLNSPSTIRLTADSRPLIVIDRIKNETDQHLNTVALTDVIRTKVIRSGLFQFTDKDSRAAVDEEVAYQQESGRVRADTATEWGRQIGADYIVTGRMVSYEEQSGRQTRKSYKLIMNLINLETAIIEWADEQTVTKAKKRPLIGG